MGTTLCKEQENMRPTGSITGVDPSKINIIGFTLNADTRALRLYCDIAGIDAKFIEINMLAGEHKKAEFTDAHPSGHLPIVQDRAQSVYGSTLIQMMHMSNRYPDKSSLHITKENLPKLNNLFACYEQRVAPVMKRIRTMLISKHLNLQPAPSQEQLNREIDELNQRILPLLNH